MGFVTNDPKKGPEQLPSGARGLEVDLGHLACPECRREVPDWRTDCPDCLVDAVPKNQLPSLMPAIPAHLLAGPEDEADEDEADEDE